MSVHDWPLERYSVGIAVSATNVTGLSNFRTVSFETGRVGLKRYSGTLWFWSGPPAHGNLSTPDTIGRFRRDYLHVYLDPGFFDGVYALLRSERPVLLRFREDQGTVTSMELVVQERPVGGVEEPVGLFPNFVDLGDMVADLELVVRDNN